MVSVGLVTLQYYLQTFTTLTTVSTKILVTFTVTTAKSWYIRVVDLSFHATYTSYYTYI